MPRQKGVITKQGYTPAQALDRIVEFIQERPPVFRKAAKFTVPEIEPGNENRYLHLYLTQALRHLVALGYMTVRGRQPRIYKVQMRAFNSIITARKEVRRKENK